VMINILAPAAILVLWSLCVLAWMARSRFAALDAAKVNLSTTKPGSCGQDLEGVLPDAINWKAHNYTHLMEQPTLFYATVVILALSGAGLFDVLVAWAYVLLRIVHSVWQCTVNTLPTRIALFKASTICLTLLAVRAVVATLYA